MTYILANMLHGNEELGAEVVFGDSLIIDDSKATNTSQNKILRHFAPQALQSDKKDVCSSYPGVWSAGLQLIALSLESLLLGLNSPESYLPVIESNLV